MPSAAILENELHMDSPLRRGEGLEPRGASVKICQQAKVATSHLFLVFGVEAL